MIGATRFCGTFLKMRAEPVTYDMPMHVAQERLMKAIRDGREGYVAEDLARLNSGKIAADKIEALFTPDEIKGAVDKLVPDATAEVIVSGDRKIVVAADETASWADLDDYDAREMGGDSRTKSTQRSTRFERSLAALRDAADLLK
jgi:hypothetical protein